MAPFAKWEQVKVIKVIPEPFTIEGGELTPTLKLKRDPIKKKYGALIESIYEYMLELLSGLDESLFQL